ncbi:MAG: sulfatase [marine bacterium B5-7]|nr:MAG: sulfatase [marine bacterium B5-7]
MIDPGNRNAHPNFILFCTDQQRADFLGCTGHPVLKTPNIDSISAGGVRFDRCYVSSPQCMPNRSTMMTGRTPSAHGVRTNGIPLSLQANTFVDLLRYEGYRTALIGKSHLQNMLDAEPYRIPESVVERNRKGVSEFADAWKPIAQDNYDQEGMSTWRGYGYVPYRRNYYGFEYVDLCTLHGDTAGGDYYRWLKRQRYDADELRGRDNALPHDYICPQAWRTAVPEELYPTRYIQQRAVEWLKSSDTRRNEKPFFLMVSFPDPHHPFTPPGRYWDMYRPEDMAVPASLEANATPTPFLKHTREYSRGVGANEYHAMSVNRREAQEANALTCGMIAMIDDAVGEVLKALADSGLSDSTVLAFTSDHGDLMGDHGLILKGPFHYQGLIRVPLLWSDPYADTDQVNACQNLVGTMDIAPTILERTGITPFHGMNGRSLLGLMQEETPPWRSHVIVEEEQHDGVLGHDGPLRLRTLVTDRFRMTIYADQKWGELYDLHDDPNELQNLWDDPGASALRADMMYELAFEQIRMTDLSPYPVRLG